ncbi:hypothetical protein SDIAM103S_03250 [Streptomyces diastaticus subsp. diastaticus]
MAVDEHARQPAGRVRRHLHGAVPDAGARALGLVRGPRRGSARARRGGLLAGRGGADGPARPTAHDARRAGVDGPVGGAARFHDAPGGDRRRRLPGRRLDEREPSRGAGDDGRHRAARGPGAGLLAQLLGHQPRLRRVGDGGRVHRAVQLPRRVPRRGGDDADLRDPRLRQAAGVPARAVGAGAGRRGRGEPGDGLARRAVHGRGRAVVPGRASLPAGGGGAAGGDGPRGVQSGRLRPGHRGERRADRGAPDPRHAVHRAPGRGTAADALHAARRVRLRADRLRRVGRGLRADRLRLDPRRDHQRADPDQPGRPPLPGPRTRPLPGHVHAVLGGRGDGGAADVRRRPGPVGRGLAVGRLRRHRDGRGRRVLAARPGARRGEPDHARRDRLGPAGPEPAVEPATPRPDGEREQDALRKAV